MEHDDLKCLRVDLWLALLTGLVVLVMLAAVYRASGFEPVWVIPIAVTWFGAWLFRKIQFERGVHEVAALRVITKEFKRWVVSAAVFAAVMPAIFPNEAYTQAKWLVWINASLFLSAIVAIPSVQLVGFLILVFASSRIGKKK